MTSLKPFTRNHTAGFIAHLATPAGTAALSDYIEAGGLFDSYAIEWRRRHLAGDDTPIPPPEYRCLMRALPDDLGPLYRTVGPPIVEHGQRYTSGATCIRDSNEHVERIYPLDVWIRDEQQHGAKILRRTISVVEDWHEVPRP